MDVAGVIIVPRRPRCAVLRSASRGQAAVEAALSFTLLVLIFSLIVSVGLFMNYAIGLDNAASAAALAASEGYSGGTASSDAVRAVNQEQNTSAWAACGSPVVAPCVSVATLTQSTGGSATITVEQVTLHGTFTPMFNILGTSFPITVTAGANISD
jgi:Flp pilus assembly protein TadG